MDPGHVFIIAGEVSGDMHASGLMEELSRRRPGLRFSGLGGARLQDAGMRLLYHSDQLSFMGFAEVLRHLPFLRRVMRDVRSFLTTFRPGLVILVDYPAFNLRVARLAHRLGCKVLYYISPQVWAWHEERVVKLAEHTDAIASVLPFEEDFFQQKGREFGVTPTIRFVGHPLVDTAIPLTDPSTFRSEMLLPPEAPIVAMLPGSRQQEIARLLPPMAQAVTYLRLIFPDIVPALCTAPGVRDETYESLLQGTGLERAPSIPASGVYEPTDGLHLVRGRNYDLLKAARGAMVASGTATLETGLIGTPMVIVYRMNRISFWIGRRRVSVPHIGLVNLVAGKRLVPELLQKNVTGTAIVERLAPMLDDGPLRTNVLEGLEQMRNRLGEGGATGRVAEMAEALLEEQMAGKSGQ